MTRSLPLIPLVLSAAALLPLPVLADAGRDARGPLDQPLPDVLLTPGRGTNGGAVVTGLEPAPGVVDQKSLEREVRKEQKKLEKLDRRALKRRAEKGERGAQVALGTDFAREAEKLAFAPRAANAALSDAVRWYSLAASRGYPGAPALDRAGVSFYPIRIQRERP